MKIYCFNEEIFSMAISMAILVLPQLFYRLACLPGTLDLKLPNRYNPIKSIPKYVETQIAKHIAKQNF